MTIPQIKFYRLLEPQDERTGEDCFVLTDGLTADYPA